MQYMEQVPDSVKVATAVAAPMFSVFGVTVEEWTYILSAVVSVMFIIEKSPIVWKKLKTFGRWIADRWQDEFRDK